MTDFTRAMIDEAFEQMGERLSRQHVVGELVVYGQAAILLQFDDDELVTTTDVDVRIDAHHGAIEKAAHEIARQHGWLRSWLSEAMTAYLPRRQSIRLFEMYPTAQRVGLRVWVALPEFLLALKLDACRHDDLNDAILLAKHVRYNHPAALGELFRSFFPDPPPDPIRDARRALFILDVADSFGGSQS